MTHKCLKYIICLHYDDETGESNLFYVLFLLCIYLFIHSFYFIFLH